MSLMVVFLRSWRIVVSFSGAWRDAGPHRFALPGSARGILLKEGNENDRIDPA
nr:hypothetical protein [Kibdelosporangium sp. MJ126-NF4]CTQ90767.1 hypothetical protein [Kibdelosporangium sp. MJ126-NF4]